MSSSVKVDVSRLFVLTCFDAYDVNGVENKPSLGFSFLMPQWMHRDRLHHLRLLRLQATSLMQASRSGFSLDSTNLNNICRAHLRCPCSWLPSQHSPLSACGSRWQTSCPFHGTVWSLKRISLKFNHIRNRMRSNLRKYRWIRCLPTATMHIDISHYLHRQSHIRPYPQSQRVSVEYPQERMLGEKDGSWQEGQKHYPFMTRKHIANLSVQQS